MPTVAHQVRGVAQLLRVKPVLSWGVSALILGAAVSHARVGASINLFNGLLAVALVVVAQGIVSHGLNDAYDWITGTDRESIGKGTGGSRVIPEGKMTLAGTITAEEWNDSASAWDPVNVTMGDFELEAWSLTEITPPSVTARVTLRDTTDDTRRDVLIHARRGRSRVLIRPPEGRTITQPVADVFTDIGSDQTTDPNPTQGILARDTL